MKNFFKKLGRATVGRKGVGNTLTVVIIVAVIMLNILAYTVTNAFGLYAYSTESEDLSISGNTDDLFAEAIKLGKKVKITFCYPEDTLKTHDTGKFVLKTAKAFEERYPGFIELRFINLLRKMDEEGNIVDLDQYKQILCPHCSKAINLADIDKSQLTCTRCSGKLTSEDLSKTITSFKQNTIIFECGEGRERVFRVLTDNYTSAGFVDFYILDSSGSIVSYNGEEVMAAMISWVLHSNHPTVYFTQNHGETADVAFSNLLTCAGYYVEVINLRKQEIPKDAGAVIISNPTSDFERAVEDAVVRGEIEKLDDYLENGGKLYVALDPYVKQLSNLEGLLEKWGISLSAEESSDGVLLRNVVKESANAITSDGYTFVATHADNEVSNKILSKVQKHGSDRVLLSDVVRLELAPDASQNLTVEPLLISGSTSVTYAGGNVTDREGNYAVAAYSSKTVGEKTSTLFVIPTAYITATDAFVSDGYSNKDFLYATLEVLFDSNPTPYGCNQVLYNTQLLENFTMGRARAYTAMILAIPAALALCGLIIIVRRKNR